MDESHHKFHEMDVHSHPLQTQLGTFTNDRFEQTIWIHPLPGGRSLTCSSNRQTRVKWEERASDRAYMPVH